MPTPNEYIYIWHKVHPSLRKGALVPCKYTLWVDVHLPSPSECYIRKSLIFEKVRRKRHERLSLKIGQALDSRQRLIADNPQNDNCKSNEKYSVKQIFEG